MLKKKDYIIIFFKLFNFLNVISFLNEINKINLTDDGDPLTSAILSFFTVLILVGYICFRNYKKNNKEEEDDDDDDIFD
jgi:hypothetical protein